jgi:hypothetical protein
MPATPKNYSTTQIIQGPGDIWAIPVAVAPTNAAVRLTLASDGTPDATTHAGSVHLGSIATGITTSVKPKLTDIHVDQFDGAIDSYVTELDAKIEAEMAQTESSKIQRMLGVGVYASTTVASGDFSGSTMETCTFGGINTVPKTCLAVISPTRANPQQYVVSVLYIGYSVGAFSLALGRAKAASYKAQFAGLSDPTRTAGQQIGVVYQTLVNASGGTPTAKSFVPAEIFQGPADLWILGTAPLDASGGVVSIDPTTLTPDSTVHGTCTHLGLTEGAATFSVTAKIDPIKADQFEAPVDCFVASIAAKLEVTLLQSSMQMLATALGVGNYSTTANSFAQCTFGGTNQPPSICVAAIAPKRLAPTKPVCAGLYLVNAAEGISWVAQRSKPSTYKVGFNGYSDVTRTAGRQIGIWQEIM